MFSTSSPRWSRRRPRSSRLLLSWPVSRRLPARPTLGRTPPPIVRCSSSRPSSAPMVDSAENESAAGGLGPFGEEGDAFSTPDAVLAIAGAAQSTLAYDTAAGSAGVRAIRKDGNDGLALPRRRRRRRSRPAARRPSSSSSPPRVGLDPARFDPDGDGAADLVAAIEAGRGSDGSYGFFNETLIVPVAHRLAGRTTDAQDADLHPQRAALGRRLQLRREPDGEALRQLRRRLHVPRDPRPRRGRRRGRDRHALWRGRSRSWPRPRTPTVGSAFDGVSNVNTTAVANLGIEAAGYDLESSCWRVANGGARRATSRRTPISARQQRSDGSIAEPDALRSRLRLRPVRPGPASQLRADPPVDGRSRARRPATAWSPTDGGVFTEGDAGFVQGSTGDLT